MYFLFAIFWVAEGGGQTEKYSPLYFLRAVSDESVAVEAPGVQFNVNETFIQKFSKVRPRTEIQSC